MLNEFAITDNQLLMRVRWDDTAAFTEIYDRYWDKMYGSAIRIVHTPSDAEDILQDVFCSLWRRRHSLDVKQSLQAYLLTATKYSAIHFIENNITRHKYYRLLCEAAANLSVPVAEDRLQLQEYERQISRTVDQMPKKMRLIYQLSRSGHLSNREIAGKLRLAESTVKKQISNALKIIRTSVDEFFLVFFAVNLLNHLFR